MKMINAGTANIADHAQYQYNCNRALCKRPYYVPVPSLEDVQLFVNFGAKKPDSLNWTMLEACTHNSTATATPGCFKIAYSGSYWYGIFKGFTSASTFALFSMALEVVYEDTSSGTFFSEQYETQQAGCLPFTKVSVCYPTNYDAEDMNGIYIGNHSGFHPISGAINLIYQHSYWVRDAEVVEVQNNILYTASSLKNFATKLNKIFELRTELVPGWYKDYLLAVYFRGNFFINDIATKASDLAFENVVEEANLWKPWVKIDKELKGAFGCAPVECSDACDACVPPTLPALVLPEGYVGAPYSYTFTAGGTAPFYVTDKEIPTWMDITIDGNQITLSGTPDDSGGIKVEFQLNNMCGDVFVDVDGLISGEEPPEVVTIEGELSYTCVPGGGGSQGLARLELTFPAPLPAAMTFVFGQYSTGGSSPYVATNRMGSSCFTMPPAASTVAACGFQYTVPMGTTNIVINGGSFLATNCGAPGICGPGGWTCIDHLPNAPDVTSIYAKITTPGYESGLESADFGLVVVNE